MKLSLLLVLVGVTLVCGQFNPFQFPPPQRFNNFAGFRDPFRRPNNQRPRPAPQSIPQQQGSRDKYELVQGSYTWQEAVNQCTRRNMKPVSVNDGREFSIVKSILGDGSGRVPYIWVGATKVGPNHFRYTAGDGTDFTLTNEWGFGRRKQPDNFDGNENCLAVLNNTPYKTGTHFHDIECHHRKPVLCERD